MRDKDCVPNLVGRAFGKQPLGRLRMKWEDNIKMDLKQEGRKVMELVDCFQWWTLRIRGVGCLGSATRVLDVIAAADDDVGSGNVVCVSLKAVPYL
jgi:hypothetical protein